MVIIVNKKKKIKIEQIECSETVSLEDSEECEEQLPNEL
jgi:hypothetical protein